MTDGLSSLYQELLSGSYDCVDRIGDRLKPGGSCCAPIGTMS